MNRYFRYRYLLLALLSNICLLHGPVHAEDTDYFDGSEFRPPSYRDPSFDKQDYRDIKTNALGSMKKYQTGSIELLGGRRKKDRGVQGIGEEEPKEDTGERSEFEKEEKYAAIHELAGDWVPDKIDLTSNGGFSIAPFNGTPVPYELNGHVDPQRGKPWAMSE